MSDDFIRFDIFLCLLCGIVSRFISLGARRNCPEIYYLYSQKPMFFLPF